MIVTNLDHIMKSQMFLYIAQMCLLFCFVTSQSNEVYTQSAFLDPAKKFQMLWNYNATHITIEVRVNAIGWVAIGFSENGNMIGADIHLGWVDNGTAYITDRHGLSFNGYPPLDEEQNVELLEGWECDGKTVLKFVRQLAACEKDQDRFITENTVRVIYAYSDDDPENVWAISKHQFDKRGVKSLYMFQSQTVHELPENDVEILDLVSVPAPIPRKRTYYQCSLLKMPKFGGKRHIVKMEPIFEERFRAYVHHLVIQICDGIMNDNKVGYSEECYIRNAASEFDSCRELIATWAVGSGAVTFPNHVGYPIGESGQSRYVKLEIHYDNSDWENTEIATSTGMRLFYTSTLRQYDAGSLYIGYTLSSTNLIIPPRTHSYKIYADCSSSCLSPVLQMSGEESIKIFNVHLHSHLAGRRIRLRHLRNGTELPVVVKDDSYDFDYQQPRVISPEREIKQGYNLQIVCEYSSSDKDRAIVGGLDTTKEMCDAFTLYYPKIPLSSCSSFSSTVIDVLSHFVGVEGIRRINQHKQIIRSDLTDLIVTAPQQMANKTLDEVISNHKWDKETTDSMSEQLRTSGRYQLCVTQPIIPGLIYNYREPFVINKTLPEEEPAVCVAPSTGFSTETNVETCENAN